MDKSLLAWILYASGRSALGVMSEIGVTLSRFLMRRSAATEPVAIASCLSVVDKLNQAVIGWVGWAFLELVAQGVNPERAARLRGLLSALALAPV